MEDWREVKDFWAACSEAVLRATLMSTMEPEVIEGGRRMEGNSICWGISGTVCGGGRVDIQGVCLP